MPDLAQRIRERLAELREAKDNSLAVGIHYACDRIAALLDAPDEAEETIALSGGDWTIRRTGDVVSIEDADGQERHRSSGIQTAVHLAMQLAGVPQYHDQWPESARLLADAIRERDEARAAARWLRRELDSYGWGSAVPLEQSLKRYPWLAESEAANGR